jgi:hypothetical protein
MIAHLQENRFTAHLFAAPAATRWDAPAIGTRSSARRGWASLGLLLAGTLMVAVVSSSISLRVSAERTRAEKIARANAALAADLKGLEAELRVRMRLPQLERWNADILGLRPIEASQFLASPILLASYGSGPLAEAPALALHPAPPAAPAVLRTAALPTPHPAGKPSSAALPAPPAQRLDPLLVAAVDELARTESTAVEAPALIPIAAEAPRLP